MPYLIIAYDHPDMDDAREAVRAAHRAHLASVGDRLLASGALLAEDGRTIIGGASILDTEVEAEALAFESHDPYAKVGIRKDVTIVPWRLRWWRGAFIGDTRPLV